MPLALRRPRTLALLIVTAVVSAVALIGARVPAATAAPSG
jgi:hypothetical protein